MVKKDRFLIFRTDRIGDFLTTAILIKSIRRNNPNCYITIVASKNNFRYVSSFFFVDEVIILKSTILSRLKVLFKLRKSYFDYVIIHDNKKRSKLISFFLKKNKKILVDNSLNKNHIDIIKIIISTLGYNFKVIDLDILNNRKQFFFDLKFKRYLVLHFDEKWIKNTYIKNYTNIEPSEHQLANFINDLYDKTKLPIIITTGIKVPYILDKCIKSINNRNVLFFRILNFFEIETVISKSYLLISCHGFVSHVAAASRVKQIDIIDKSYNYERWTKHFRNYTSVYREPFDQLNIKILNKI